jgi:uncharacterized repeat protein (TIGR04138 family)
MDQEFETIVEAIHECDTRYKPDSYAFVMEALAYTQKKFKAQRHVSAAEILDGMKELLLAKYGPMAIAVLQYWGIKSTEDFGNIIFNLIERKILSKTEEDSSERFRNAYDFQEVFCQDYREQLLKKISRMRPV